MADRHLPSSVVRFVDMLREHIEAAYDHPAWMMAAIETDTPR